MDKETLRKGEILYNKLTSLINNKDRLVNAKAVTDINITINTCNCKYNYVQVGIKYLAFDKLKTFLLEEINKELIKTQKEFAEL